MNRFGQTELALQAIQTGCDDTAGDQIGIDGAVDGFELKIGCFGPDWEGTFDHANGRFPVFEAPAGIGAGPVMGLQPLVADDTGCPQRRHFRQAIQ